MSRYISLSPEAALIFVAGFLIAALAWLLGRKRDRPSSRWFALSCICLACLAGTFRLGLGDVWAAVAATAATACYIAGVVVGRPNPG